MANTEACVRLGDPTFTGDAVDHLFDSQLQPIIGRSVSIVKIPILYGTAAAALAVSFGATKL